MSLIAAVPGVRRGYAKSLAYMMLSFACQICIRTATLPSCSEAFANWTEDMAFDVMTPERVALVYCEFPFQAFAQCCILERPLQQASALEFHHHAHEPTASNVRSTAGEGALQTGNIVAHLSGEPYTSPPLPFPLSPLLSTHTHHLISLTD